MQLADFGKTLIVSPHLDDAVLSCGDLMARCPGMVVLTVFAGIPPDPGQRTKWDEAAGFGCAGEAIAVRRDEDRQALAVLAATPVWLTFCDSQYHASPPPAALESALGDAIRRLGPDNILLPAGLFHSDHLLVHQALMEVRRKDAARNRLLNWLLYGEALYRRIPGLLQQRLDDLAGTGTAAVPLSLCDGEASQRKRQAVQCYASQLRALQSTVDDGYGDAFMPEACWRLERAAAGPG